MGCKAALIARYDLTVRAVYIVTMSVVFFGIWGRSGEEIDAGFSNSGQFWLWAIVLYSLVQPRGLGMFAGDFRSGRIVLLQMSPCPHWIRLSGQDLARRMPSVLILLSLIVYACVSLDDAMPSHPIEFITLTLAMAYLIGFQIELLISQLAFYMPYQLNLSEMRQTLLVLCSGLLIPPEEMPAWLSQLVQLTPYPYLVGLPPQSLASESGRLGEVLWGQSIWAAALTAMVVWSMRKIGPSRETFGG